MLVIGRTVTEKQRALLSRSSLYSSFPSVELVFEHA